MDLRQELKTRYGLHLTEDGLKLCEAEAKASGQSQNLLQSIYQQAINVSLKSVAVACLPDDFKSMERFEIPGPVLLQVISSCNLSAPTYKQGSQGHSRMTGLVLTDGFTRVNAVEMERVPEFKSYDIAPGTKVVFNSIQVVYGVIHMKASSIKTTCGQVANLKQSWEMKEEATKTRSFLKSLEDGEDPPPPFIPFSRATEQQKQAINASAAAVAQEARKSKMQRDGEEEGEMEPEEPTGRFFAGSEGAVVEAADASAVITGIAPKVAESVNPQRTYKGRKQRGRSEIEYEDDEASESVHSSKVKGGRDLDALISAVSISSGESKINEKQDSKVACGQCTFLNHPSMLQCEMCGSPITHNSSSTAKKGKGKSKKTTLDLFGLGGGAEMTNNMDTPYYTPPTGGGKGGSGNSSGSGAHDVTEKEQEVATIDIRALPITPAGSVVKVTATVAEIQLFPPSPQSNEYFLQLRVLDSHTGAAAVGVASRTLFNHFLGSSSDVGNHMQSNQGQNEVRSRLENMQAQVKAAGQVCTIQVIGHSQYGVNLCILEIGPFGQNQQRGNRSNNNRKSNDQRRGGGGERRHDGGGGGEKAHAHKNDH